MKMFDADSLVEKLEAEVIKLYMRGHVAAEHHVQNHALRIVYAEPTVDAVPVVRCKDCWRRGKDCECPMCHKEYFYDEDDGGDWELFDETADDGFCYMGAKMDGGAEDEEIP